MDWIAEVDRIDKLLHSEGFTDSERTRRIEALMNVYADIEKARRDNAAMRSKMSVLVERCRHNGTTETARDEGITSRGMRKRKQSFFAKYGTVKAL
jgi:hypothetical protein